MDRETKMPLSPVFFLEQMLLVFLLIFGLLKKQILIVFASVLVPFSGGEIFQGPPSLRHFADITLPLAAHIADAGVCLAAPQLGQQHYPRG